MTYQKTVIEEDDIRVTCSTYGKKQHLNLQLVHIYLCKDGKGVSKQIQKKDVFDTEMTMRSVSTQESGEYSCVFSETEYPHTEVSGTGDNSIFIEVKGKNPSGYSV